MNVLLIFVFLSASVSSESRLASVEEMTSITNVLSGGRGFSFRCFATGRRGGGRGVYRHPVNSHVHSFIIRVWDLWCNGEEMGGLLAAAPGRVSLLTTRPWMLGSQAVGPYTSLMGTMSYMRPGLKRERKARTRSDRTGRVSITSFPVLFTSNASSKFGMMNRIDLGGKSFILGIWRDNGVPVIPTMIFWLAIHADMLKRILWPAWR